MGTLYIIATPIGNLEDISLRALRVLKEVDYILCEDTRVSRKLLDHYEITAQLESYNSHASEGKEEKIRELLESGQSIALISDSGTPTISDPGCHLVSSLRTTLGSEANIIPIPGASAVTTALSASGLPSSEFLFLGFLPHKKGRETLFKEITESKRTVAFYESPHRILKALESLNEYLENDRKVVVGRELTKMFEEIIRGTSEEVLQYFKDNKDKVKGEFVVMVEGK